MTLSVKIEKGGDPVSREVLEKGVGTVVESHV